MRSLAYFIRLKKVLGDKNVYMQQGKVLKKHKFGIFTKSKPSSRHPALVNAS